MTDPRPDRPEIRDALDALARLGDSGLPVRYAEMWLREAESAVTHGDEAGHLAKAETQLGQALIASAAPSPGLAHAYALIQKARSEATD